MGIEFDRLVLAEQKLKVSKLKQEVFRNGLRNVIASIFVIPMFTLISGLGVMLGLGAAHDQWPAIPALGYWSTVLILWGIGGITGTMGRGNKTRLKSTDAVGN